MPRRLSTEELNSIAMQVFIQDASEAAAAAAGLTLKPGPLEWDGGSMEVRTGEHRVVIATSAGVLAFAVPHGAADDLSWQQHTQAALARAIAQLVGHRDP